MPHWGNFKLTKLDVFCRNVPGDIPKIYGNSRNQAEITIGVEGCDRVTGNPVKLEKEDLNGLLYLCISETGERLGPPWKLSDEANEYTILATESNQQIRSRRETNDIIYIYKYLSCSEGDITANFSVGIDIPDVGAFDTSNNGTKTKNGGGAVFKSPKSFKIKTLHKIDYSTRENIMINVGDSENIKRNLKWTSKWDKIYTDHNDGKCNRYIVYIKPNGNSTGQEKFKKHEIKYDNIQNTHVNTGSVPWEKKPDYVVLAEYISILSGSASLLLPSESEINGFTVLKKEQSLPCAVIGKAIGQDFHLNLWYPIQKNARNIEIDGYFMTQDSSLLGYTYRFHCDYLRIDDLNYEDGIVKLNLFKFKQPENNLKPLKWDNVIHPVTIKVTDLYGTEGEFTLTFDDNECFDKPGVKLK